MPDDRWELEYCYGYRSADSRNNVHYNANGNAVYITACLGVVLDQGNNTQKFFGAKPAETSHKSRANDMDQHTNDIMCIAISADGRRALTGQVNNAPVMFLWDACTGEKIQRFKLPAGSKGVIACSISADGDCVGCVDDSNEHKVHVYGADGSL
jgi:WD40 repeat protein